jgi:phosphohistidine phosphatase
MTVRTLVILRHAKAEPPERYEHDVDRPLNARGRRDAVAAGAWLAELGVPDLVLCSTAVRTRETWQGVLDGLGPSDDEPVVVYERALYSGGVPEALDLVAATQPEVAHVLLIGHDPTLSLLSRLLDPAGSASDGLSTAGIAVHQFDGAWRDLGPGGAKAVELYKARG